MCAPYYNCRPGPRRQLPRKRLLKHPDLVRLGDLYQCEWRRSGAFRENEYCDFCTQECSRPFFDADCAGIGERLEAACQERRLAFSVRTRNYSHKWRSQKNSQGRGLTVAEWKALLETYHGKCAYCGVGGKLAMDHVWPLSKGGRHDVANVVPACTQCNSSKKDRIVLVSKQFRL